MSSTEATGIGLLVFNRPTHTRRVLDGLAANDIDHLYVFADAPRSEEEWADVERTREVVKETEFCNIELIERDENLGLEDSFISAYDHLFNHHSQAIVFEDDCVPAGDCVEYMQACLEKYEGNDRVMNIHAYGPPIDLPEGYEHDIYFTWRSGSWGQATWRDEWAKFDRDPSLLDRIQSDDDFRRRVRRAGSDMIPMLKQELRGEIDSVGVWWALTLVRHEGVSVNPVTSRVRNIGIDGTGVHSGTSTSFEVDIEPGADFDGLSYPPTVEVDPTINARYNRFITEGLRGRVRRWLKVRYRELLG